MNASVIAEMKRLCEKHRWKVDFSLPDFRDRFIAVSCYDLCYIYKETNHEEFLKEFKSFLDLTKRQHITLYTVKSIEEIEFFFKQFPNQNKTEFFRLRCGELSEDTLTHFERYVDFDVLAYRKICSEEFIEKNLKNFNWNYVCENQRVSVGFIKKHIDLMDNSKEKSYKDSPWDCLLRNNKIIMKDVVGKLLIDYTQQCIDIQRQKESMDGVL